MFPIQEIIDLIAEGQDEEGITMLYGVIQDLADIKSEVLLQKGRLAEVTRLWRINNIKYEDYNIEKSRIRSAIIEICRQIENNPEAMDILLRAEKRRLVFEYDNSITVDFSLITNKEKGLERYLITEFQGIGHFLNHLYFTIKNYVNPYTYGKEWVLVDRVSDMKFEYNRILNDTRSPFEVGIKSGCSYVIKRIEVL